MGFSVRFVRCALAGIAVVGAFTASTGMMSQAIADGGCDADAADATEASWLSTVIAPSGSLTAGAQVTTSVLVHNALNQCVAGGSVGLFFGGSTAGSTAGSVGGSASSPSCVSPRLTPNWTTCTADANGLVTVTYATPVVLPNGGQESLQAKVGTQLPPAISYTYGALAMSPVSVTATEGAVFTATVASISERNFATAPPLSATIDWGDGTSSAGRVGSGTATGAVVVTGTHTYVEESPLSGYQVHVTASTANTATVSSVAAYRVSDAALHLATSPISLHRNVTLTAAVATFSDADPAGTAADYTATIGWGDGTSSAGTVTVSAAGSTVTGTHTYNRGGSYVTTVSLADAGGATATATGAATVSNGRG